MRFGDELLDSFMNTLKTMADQVGALDEEQRPRLIHPFTWIILPIIFTVFGFMVFCVAIIQSYRDDEVVWW